MTPGSEFLLPLSGPSTQAISVSPREHNTYAYVTVCTSHHTQRAALRHTIHVVLVAFLGVQRSAKRSSDLWLLFLPLPLPLLSPRITCLRAYVLTSSSSLAQPPSSLFLFPADSSCSAPPRPSLWGLKRMDRCQRHRSLVDASDSRLRVSPHCSHRGDHSIVSTHHHYHLIVLAGCCVHDGVLW